MILAEDYPALSQLLAAYFHEDWKMDARNYAQLVREFVASEPVSLVGQAAVELRDLLATPLSESELEQALDELGCYLYPAGTGLTVRAWLEEVSALLGAA